jgi:hypothetical protein
MHEAAISEFPFVESLPKREKSKLAKAWDSLREMASLSETEGQLLPVNLTCKLLDLSRTRVDEYCADGRLRRIKVADHVFITEKSVVELAQQERKIGRPLNVATTFKECLKRARQPQQK